MEEHTPIQSIRAETIEQALQQHTRQYLAGNLKQPQTLQHIADAKAEFGISDYTAYHWEAAHYHTVTSEYCYILSGTTKYVDLFDGTEHEFRAGDFYILRKNTPYIQKCQAGCRLLFAKVPGINDKISIPMLLSFLSFSYDELQRCPPEPEGIPDTVFQISGIRKMHQFFIIYKYNKCRRFYRYLCHVINL